MPSRNSILWISASKAHSRYAMRVAFRKVAARPTSIVVALCCALFCGWPSELSGSLDYSRIRPIHWLSSVERLCSLHI